MASYERDFPTRPINEPPKGLHVERPSSGLMIWFRWNWLDLGSIGVLAGFMVALMILSTALYAASASAVIAFVGAVVIAIGPACWILLAGIINRTVIRIEGKFLVVRHEPVPWPGGLRRRADEILQVYCQAGLWHKAVCVRAMMVDGTRVSLTHYLPGGKALWGKTIEREIEGFLKIVDRPIVCENCGYDLRTVLNRCPECGQKLPWAKRQKRQWARRLRNQGVN